MPGIILPSVQLAADHLVEVCDSCSRRCCLLVPRFRCEWRRWRDEKRVHAPRKHMTVAALRELAAEHPSYLRTPEGVDLDGFRCIEDVKELTAQQRQVAVDKPEPGWTLQDRARLHAGYLAEEHGLDHEQCAEAIRDIWPEAAQALDEARLALHAERMEGPHMGGAR